MNRKARLAKCERTLASQPAANLPLSEDAVELGEAFVCAYWEMIQAFPDYYADQRQRLLDETAGYEKRLIDKVDYPGVQRSLEALVQRNYRQIAVQDALHDLMAMVLTGLDDPAVEARFQAVTNNPVEVDWIFDLCQPPPPRIAGDHPAVQTVNRFWQVVWMHH